MENAKVGQAGSFGAAVIAAANFSISTGCCMEEVQRAKLIGFRHVPGAIFIVMDIRDIWQWWNCGHWWRSIDWRRCWRWWWWLCVVSWSCAHRWFGCTDYVAALISIVARKALTRLARADEGIIGIPTARLLSVGASKLL